MRKKGMQVTCRVCLTETQYYNSFNETISKDNAQTGITYIDCFTTVTKLTADPSQDDLFPQQICEGCSKDLCAAYRFVCKAQQTDIQLRYRSKPRIVGDVEKDKESNFVKIAIREDSAIEMSPKKNIENLSEGSEVHDENIREQYSIEIEQTQKCDDLKSYIECKVCKRHFPPAKYSIHFRKIHAEAPNGFQCPKCPKQFAYPYRLKSHFEVHHDIRPKNVSCALCPKKFYSKKLLNAHMLSHGSNDINYKCELCGKGFQRVFGLRRHMIMHYGGREQCTECDKRFPNTAELRIHMLTHTKETQFLCAICGQGFRRQGPLSYHMRKHRGEKYTCVHCKQQFTCLSSMRRHEYKHIGLPFKCPRCYVRQATRKILERHVKEKHQFELTTAELREIYSTVQNSRLQ